MAKGKSGKLVLKIFKLMITATQPSFFERAPATQGGEIASAACFAIVDGSPLLWAMVYKVKVLTTVPFSSSTLVFIFKVEGLLPAAVPIITVCLRFKFPSLFMYRVIGGAGLPP